MTPGLLFDYIVIGALGIAIACFFGMVVYICGYVGYWNLIRLTTPEDKE